MAGRGARLRDRSRDRARRVGSGSNLAQLGATTSAMAFAALGRGRHGVGDPLLGGRADRLGRLRGARGAGADGRRGAVDRAVAVAVSPRAPSWPTRPGAGCWAAASVLDDTARLLAVAFARGRRVQHPRRSSIAIARGAAVPRAAGVEDRGQRRRPRWCSWGCRSRSCCGRSRSWRGSRGRRCGRSRRCSRSRWRGRCALPPSRRSASTRCRSKGAGKVVDALIMPLVAVALLWLIVALPKTLARMALSGAAGGGGFASRTASRVAARRVDAGRDADRAGGLGGRGGPAAGRRRRSSRRVTARRRGDAGRGRACRGRARAGSAAAGHGRRRGDAASARRPRRRPAPARRRPRASRGWQAPEGVAAASGQQTAGGRRRRAAQPVVAGDQGSRPGRARGRGAHAAPHDPRDVAGAMRALSPARAAGRDRA